MKIPKGEGVYPILAQGEGSRLQTGLILKAKNATFSSINEIALKEAGALNYLQELKIKAIHPLPVKPVQQIITAELEGDMQKYVWKINNQAWPEITPLSIEPQTELKWFLSIKLIWRTLCICMVMFLK